MLNQLPAGCRIYVACGYTDMRKQIDGLASLVQQQFKLDPFTKAFFIFCGRKRDRIKVLHWEGDGFLLLYKRLENGSFQWPRSEQDVRELTPQQYRWLLEGLSVEQKTAIPAVSARQL
jgi:transposase